MKSPLNVVCFVILCFVFTSMRSQNQALTAFPTVLYLSKEKTIVESTDESENHKILMAGVRATDLVEVLGQSGPFTIFAPSDNAFSKFSKEELQRLFSSDHKQQLKSLLTYHIVAADLSASKILRALCSGKGKASFTTIQGTKIYASISGTDIILTDSFGNTAKITSADAKQSNGFIHEIDGVIQPSKI